MLQCARSYQPMAREEPVLVTHTRRKSWPWALFVFPLIALAVGLVWLEPAPASAANCAPPRLHATGDFTETIVSSGLTREYLLHVPPSYVGNERMPLVFNWHGLGSPASGQQLYSQLPAKADEAGFTEVRHASIVLPGGDERRTVLAFQLS